MSNMINDAGIIYAPYIPGLTMKVYYPFDVSDEGEWDKIPNYIGKEVYENIDID